MVKIDKAAIKLNFSTALAFKKLSAIMGKGVVDVPEISQEELLHENVQRSLGRLGEFKSLGASEFLLAEHLVRTNYAYIHNCRDHSKLTKLYAALQSFQQDGYTGSKLESLLEMRSFFGLDAFLRSDTSKLHQWAEALS